MAEAESTDAVSVSEPFELIKLLLDDVVFVKLRGDRELEGRLHAYDSHCNLVMSDVTETVYFIDEEDEDEDDVLRTIKKQAEMLFVRGDSVILISPMSS